MLIALSFIKPNKTVDAFNDLYERSPEILHNLFNWFRNNYIDKRFPITFWSVYKRNKNNIPRTTNNIESWHKKINKFLGNSHVSFTKIIDFLKDEAMSTFDILDQIEAGFDWPIRQKKKHLKAEKRLMDCALSPLTNYHNYLKNIAFNLGNKS